MTIYGIAVYQQPFAYIYLAMVVCRSYIVYRVLNVSTHAAFTAALMVYLLRFGIRGPMRFWGPMYGYWPRRLFSIPIEIPVVTIIAFILAVIFPHAALCAAIAWETVPLLELWKNLMAVRCGVLEMFRDLRRAYAPHVDAFIRFQTCAVRTLVQPTPAHVIRSDRPPIQCVLQVLKGVHGLADIVCEYGHVFPLITTVARRRDASRETCPALTMDKMFVDMDIALTEWLGSQRSHGTISTLVPILVMDCEHSLHSRVMEDVMHNAWNDETKRVLTVNSIVVCIGEYGIYMIMRAAGIFKPITIRAISRYSDMRFPTHLFGVHALYPTVAYSRFKSVELGTWTLSCSGMPAVTVDVVYADRDGKPDRARKIDPVRYMALYVAK